MKHHKQALRIKREWSHNELSEETTRKLVNAHRRSRGLPVLHPSTGSLELPLDELTNAAQELRQSQPHRHDSNAPKHTSANEIKQAVQANQFARAKSAGFHALHKHTPHKQTSPSIPRVQQESVQTHPCLQCKTPIPTERVLCDMCVHISSLVEDLHYELSETKRDIDRNPKLQQQETTPSLSRGVLIAAGVLVFTAIISYLLV